MQVARVLSRRLQAVKPAIALTPARCFSAESDAALDAAAAASYEKNSQSYTCFPVEKIEFRVEAPEGKRSAFPQLHFDGKSEFGLTHVVPFAKILYAKFGANGNYGRPRGYAPGNVDSFQEAEQSLTVTNRKFEARGINPLIQGYFDWIAAIENKLIDHVADNLDAYPTLKSKFASLAESNGSELKAVIASSLVKSIIPSKVPVGETRNYNPDEKLLQLRQKLYVRASPDRLANARPRTELDASALKEGFVRRHIPLYNANGQEIPVEQSDLRNFDIVSAQITLNGNLYDAGSRIGFGLRKNIRSVVFLRSTVVAAPRQARVPPVTVATEAKQE
jgi:hypothetical protein